MSGTRNILVFRVEFAISKLKKGKQGLTEETAASVLLMLFISGNDRCHTPDAL